jgi:hypothetical protein
LLWFYLSQFMFDYSKVYSLLFQGLLRYL